MCRVCVKSMKKRKGKERKGVSGERGNIIYIIIIKSRAEKSPFPPLFVPFGILFYVCRNLNCPIFFFLELIREKEMGKRKRKEKV